MNIDPVARERKVLNLLDDWPWKLGGVLIGGYAIAAYGRPRYSNDVDIVVPDTAFMELEAFIFSHGFVIENSTVPNPQNYEGKVSRYKADELTLDLLVGYVRDREAQVDVPERWISKNHMDRVLITMIGRTANKIPVASPEALWALKLQSGRDQDITDLFSMSNIRVNLNEVATLFHDLRSESLIDKLRKTLLRTESKKLYEDSMSRLETKRTDKSKKDWDSFRNRIQFVVSNP